jgi:hypothetical protein
MNKNLVRCAAVAWCVLLPLAGCNRSYNHLIPAENTARKALDAALTAWQGGQAQSAQAIPGTTPPVQFVDSGWQKGQRLQSFEVVKEETSLAGPPRFVVRLTLEGEADAQEVAYVVQGSNPLWVFREADAESAGGM